MSPDDEIEAKLLSYLDPKLAEPRRRGGFGHGALITMTFCIAVLTALAALVVG